MWVAQFYQRGRLSLPKVHVPPPHPPRDETERLLLSLTVGCTLVCAAVVGACVVWGAQWHVLTSSYQIFLIGMFAGALVATTIVLGTYERTWVSRASVLVFFLGILATGAAQVFFFHLLGGARYVRRIVTLFTEVWS